MKTRPKTAPPETSTKPLSILEPTIDEFLHDLRPSRDPVLLEMEERGASQGFPIIGPLVGNLCRTLALSINARDVFEMGSGFGYSTWWFANAVGEGGRVVHTDGDAKKSAEAKRYMDRAGIGPRVVYEVGDAISVLKKYPGPFDIVFIDIDKKGYPDALELARSRVRRGGYIITDNVLWSGKVTGTKQDAETKAILRYLKEAHAAPDLQTSVIPLRDGVAVSLKVEPLQRRKR